VKTGRPLWHLLPVTKWHRPTAREIAEEKRRAALAVAKARWIEQEVRKLENRVFITFSHFGDAVDPGLTRLGESGIPEKSLVKREAADASGIWLRFRNNSRLPIQLFTDSVYLPRGQKCGYNTPQGKFFHGLCQDAEIGFASEWWTRRRTRFVTVSISAVCRRCRQTRR
jgi:hypothetical protein